jgi:hypothetical protein
MTTLILIFIGLIVVGLLIQVLGKSAGDEGAQALGGLMSGCGQTGCGCMLILLFAVIGLVFLFFFAATMKPS